MANVVLYSRGHSAIVNELIKRNVNVNRTNDDGFSPLFYAAQQNQVDICNALLAAGADPTIQGKDPNCPEAPAMCPVDHIVDSEELREVFASHETYREPSDEMVVSNVKLAVDGEFSFDVADLSEVSALPVRSWKLEFFAGEDGDRRKCAETAIQAFELEVGRDGRGHVTCKPVASCLKTIVLVADKRGEVSVDIQAFNVIGKNTPCDAGPVDMSEIFSGL